MTWFDNPVANLYGPFYLGLYAAVAAALIVVARWWTHHRDPTASLDPEPLPAEPDPYEIAYLRGGAYEVCRLAVAELLQRGYVHLEGNVVGRVADAPAEAYLPPPARAVLDWFEGETRTSFRDFLTSCGPQDPLKSYCSEVRSRLEDRQLLAGAKIRRYRYGVFGLAGLMTMGFGGYRLAVAPWNDFWNLELLVLMIATAVVLGFQLARLGGATSRGRRYLEELRQTFESFRQRISWDSTVGSDPRTLLTIGIFGAAALSGPLSLDFGTGLEDFEKSLREGSYDDDISGDGYDTE